jgi:hypothetical protein
MYQTFFTMLLSTMQSALEGVQQLVAGVVVAIAIIVGVGKVLHTLYLSRGEGGIDNFTATARHHGAIVVLVVALSFPFPGMPGGIIGGFPSLMIKAGFGTAEAFTSHLPAEFRLPFDKLGVGVDKVLKNTKTPPLDGFSKEFGKHYDRLKLQETEINTAVSWSQVLQKIALQIALAFCFMVMMIAAFFWCPVLLACLLPACWLIAGIFASWMIQPGMQVPVDPLVKLGSFVVDYIVTWATHFIFYSVVYFTFVLLMISFCIRSVIFCILAPLSLVTVPFDSKRRVLYEVLWKSVALALTPVAIAVVMSVCTYAYSILISSGMLSVIRETYVGGAISEGTVLTWEFLAHFADYILRLALYVICLPCLMAIVAMKAMFSAPKAIEEMFGVGIGDISARIPGMSQAAHVATRAAV